MKKVPLRKKTVVGVKSKKVVKSKAAVKKAPTKKTVAKKAPVKKTAAKKAAAKKAPVKKTAAKKAPVKKTAAKKAAVKKAPVKKTAAKKAPVKKTAAKKAAAKKAPAKKTAAKKARAKKVQTKKATTKKIVAQKALPPTLSVAKQLTKGDIAKFQKMLFVERDRLTATINNIEEASRTESGRDNGADLASFAETGTDSFNIETALNIASSESQRLRDVIDALDRIECGTYGICEGSGKPIPKKRLEAFPSARYCVEYQEALEKEAALSEFR